MKKVVLDVAVSCPSQIWAIVLSSCMGKETVLGNLANQAFVLFLFFNIFFFYFKVTLGVTIPGRHTLYNTQHKTQERDCSLGLFGNILRRQKPSTSCFQKFPTLCEHLLHQKMETEVSDSNPGNHQVMTFLFL